MIYPLRKPKSFTYVVITGALAFCTFYWYISSSGKHHWTNYMDGSLDFWRWECNRSISMCERIIWKYSDSGQSLRTCQMTCGSAPLWPQPNGEAILSNTSVTINHMNIKLTPINAFNVEVRDMLGAFSRDFIKEIVSDQRLNSITVQNDVKILYVSIYVAGNQSSTDLKLGMDESYMLTVKSTKRIVSVYIKSGTYFGARHALETLHQLVWFDELGSCLKILSRVKIVDSPSFPYRGLLLDTANHYLPIKAIKRTINGMSAVKMNVLHWHMTDSTSFPFFSKNKQHSIYGAYSSSKLYTKVDVVNVINYAKVRGVKVIIEIDNPGSIGQGWNWGRRKGYGDLNVCYKNKIGSCQNVDYCSQLNPNNDRSYKLFQELLQEVNEITGYPDINHLGGNVNFQCWMDSPEVTQMDIYKRKGILGVLKYHHNKIFSIISNIHNKQLPNLILWSDYFKMFNDPTKNIDSRIYIAQVNSESENEDAKVLINKGYRVIISHADKWDLSRMPHWTTVYDHRPWDQFLWSQRDQVLGGEALVWTKLIDEHTLDNRIWPTAAAVAELLWSDPQIESLSSASLRIQYLRDLLIARGIQPAAVTPKWCSHNPGACL